MWPTENTLFSSWFKKYQVTYTKLRLGVSHLFDHNFKGGFQNTISPYKVVKLNPRNFHTTSYEIKTLLKKK